MIGFVIGLAVLIVVALVVAAVWCDWLDAGHGDAHLRAGADPDWPLPPTRHGPVARRWGDFPPGT